MEVKIIQVAAKWQRANYRSTDKSGKDAVDGDISEIRPYLFLGGIGSRNKAAIKANNIKHIVNVANCEKLKKRRGVKETHIMLDDCAKSDLKAHFIATADLIRCHRDNSASKTDTCWLSTALHPRREEGGTVLVHCAAGISRSVSLVLAYLVMHEDMSLNEAYQLVKSRRTIIRPNNGFWTQLISFEKDVRGSNSVTMLPLSADRNSNGHAKYSIPSVYSDSDSIPY